MRGTGPGLAAAARPRAGGWAAAGRGVQVKVAHATAAINEPENRFVTGTLLAISDCSAGSTGVT